MDKFINQLSRRKKFHLKASGGSMLPILRPNDILYFGKSDFGHCRVSDIIIVKKNRHVFTHRVIYKTGAYLVAKGDHNPASDGKIYPKQILGKVFQVKRSGQIINLESFYLFQSSLYFAEIIKLKKAFEKVKINLVF